MPINVVQFVRRWAPGFYSLERVYDDIRVRLDPDVRVIVRVSRYFSQGLWRRLYNMLDASRSQGDVNHVTGDAHVLTYFLRRRRTVLTVLDCGMLETRNRLKRWLLWFLWFWLAEKRCAVIVVISRETKRQLLRHLRCDPDKVRVIYCNVSDEFQEDQRPFNIQRPRLLQIGTTPNKNIERLAMALAGLDVQLTIIGALSQSQRAALTFHGIAFMNRIGLSRDELVKEYQRCDLVTFVSTYEGFGLPIVEANAVGRPVVTSNLLSMPEVAGGAACLVDPLDVESIRAGILRVRNDGEYREMLIQRGFVNARRFRTQLIADQYTSLYREVYEGSRGSA